MEWHKKINLAAKKKPSKPKLEDHAQVERDCIGDYDETSGFICCHCHLTEECQVKTKEKLDKLMKEGEDK